MNAHHPRRRILFAFILLLSIFSRPNAAGEEGSVSPVQPGVRNMLDPEEKAWLEAHPVLTVAGPGAFPPFHFFDEDGHAKGMAFDYLRLLADELGLKMAVKNPIPWTEVLKEAGEGKIDLISCAARTPEREAYLLFSDPFLSFPLVIISRKDSPFIGGLDDLTGMKVALVPDNAVNEWMKRDGIEVIPHYEDSPLKALEAVSSGIAEAHIDNLAAAAYLIEKYGLANLKIAAPTSYQNYTLHMAVRRDRPELISILNKALRAITPERHAAIRSRWLSVRYEYGISLADVVKWILITAVPAVIALMTILFWNRRLQREIALHTRTENALRESERRYRELFENSRDGFVVVDAEGRFMDANPAYCGMLGYTLDELQHKTDFYEITPARWRDWEREEIWEKRLMRERYSGLYEKEYIRRDGTVFPVEIHSYAVFDHAGRPAYLWGIVRDITERRRAEEAIRKSRESYHSFVSQSHEGIYCTEFDRPIDTSLPVEEQIDAIYRNAYMGECNQAMASMYGIPSVEAFAGQRLVDFHGGKDNPVNRAGFGKFIEAGYRTVGCETEEVTPGGEKRFFLSNDIGIVENGYLVRIWGTSTDITERKRAEEERRKLEALLNQAQKMESVGRLAGGVAHDFNNMLNVILGHAELSLNDLDPVHPIVRNLTQIRNAAERSANLTRQLLAFARRQTIAPRVLDLNETVGGMLKMLRRLIGEDIDIAWLPAEGVWPVRMDPSQIDQVLANLCINARDAIRDVGKITIETGNAIFDEACCERNPELVPGEYVLLAVSDDGCGMDREILDRLFEPFFTTKELGRGTGLGLATVYGIIRQNNGFVNVYSEPGRGTIFKTYLPRSPGGEEVSGTEPDAAVIVRGHATILLVEDEATILDMTREMLELLGYTVLTAGGPGEALRLAESHPGGIHLLMTDVIMPEMNGRALAEKLQSLHPFLKHLFMSGYTANVIAHHGVLDEGVCFIQKPFSMKDLAVKVREALDAGERTGE